MESSRQSRPGLSQSLHRRNNALPPKKQLASRAATTVSEQQEGECSSLDLLSRVALGSFELRAPTPSKRNDKSLPAPDTIQPNLGGTPILSLRPDRKQSRGAAFGNMRMSYSAPPVSSAIGGAHSKSSDDMRDKRIDSKGRGASHPPLLWPEPSASGLQYHRLHSHDISTETFSPVSSDDTAFRLVDPVGKIAKTTQKAASKELAGKSRGLPSRFCHICSRTSKKVSLVPCGNFLTGCRKVICQKCFAENNWDWYEASRAQSGWVCTHCRTCCPPRAQCKVYSRTNFRRRIGTMRQREESKQEVGAGNRASKSEPM